LTSFNLPQLTDLQKNLVLNFDYVLSKVRMPQQCAKNGTHWPLKEWSGWDAFPVIAD
jgi:hypothetical protein